MKPPTQDFNGSIELRRTQSAAGKGGNSLKRTILAVFFFVCFFIGKPEGTGGGDCAGAAEVKIFLPLVVFTTGGLIPVTVQASRSI